MRNITVGIDIGSHMTRVVVTRFDTERNKLVVLGTGKSVSRGIRHGYVTSQSEATDALAQALRDAERSAQIPLKRATVALGGASLISETLTTSIAVGRGTGEIVSYDIEKLTSQAHRTLLKMRKNRRIVHAIPLHYTLDGREVLGNPLGMQGTILEVQMLFITVLEHHFDDLIDVVSHAGIHVNDVVASPLAVSASILPQRHKVVGSLLLDIGAEAVSMAVFENNTIIDTCVFPFGSSDITNDIALGFQIDLDSAEKVKRGRATDLPKKKRDEIIQARLSDIFELVIQRLTNIQRDGLLPAGVLITGGGAQLENLDEFAKKQLRLPVRIIQGKDIEQLLGKKLKDPSWCTAYGLCMLSSETGGGKQRKTGKGWWKEFKSSLQNIGEQFLP